MSVTAMPRTHHLGALAIVLLDTFWNSTFPDGMKVFSLEKIPYNYSRNYICLFGTPLALLECLLLPSWDLPEITQQSHSIQLKDSFRLQSKFYFFTEKIIIWCLEDSFRRENISFSSLRYSKYWSEWSGVSLTTRFLLRPSYSPFIQWHHTWVNAAPRGQILYEM